MCGDVGSDKAWVCGGERAPLEGGGRWETELGRERALFGGKLDFQGFFVCSSCWRGMGGREVKLRCRVVVGGCGGEQAACALSFVAMRFWQCFECRLQAQAGTGYRSSERVDELENYGISVFVVFGFGCSGDVKINRWLWLDGRCSRNEALSILWFPSARMPGSP